MTIDRAAASRNGLTADEVQMALTIAVGGMEAGQVLEGRERYSVLIRYPRELRADPSQIANVLVATPSGAQVELGQLAKIDVMQGATLVKSEDAYLNNIVYVDVRNRDVGRYVAEAKKLLEKRLSLPTGYRIQWSGQYESMQRAAQ